MTIKRREFLKAGAATATVAGAVGATGLAGTSCVSLFSDGALEMPQVPLPEMDAFLERVDRGLEHISEAEWSEGSSELRRDNGIEEESELVRKALRSLYLAGMFGDLPDEGQVHPGMQARVKRALPEMGEAIFGVCDYLEQIDDEEIAEIQRFLAEHEDPGMLVAQQLDRHTGASGVSTSRRLKTRAMVTQIVSRLKHQPPRRVFDEYIGKVRKQAAQAGSVADVQRRMTAMVGEQAYWERQQRLAVLAARWEDDGVTAGEAVPDTASASAVETPEPDRDEALESERDKLRAELDDAKNQAKGSGPADEAKGKRLMVAGGWMMGIGFVVGAGFFIAAASQGLLVYGGGLALAIIGTVGAVVALVGIVVAIVGAVKRSKAKDD